MDCERGTRPSKPDILIAVEGARAFFWILLIPSHPLFRQCTALARLV
jgi:hypothetical protein